MVGRTSTIYIAQLWIGKKSAFSVEAEVIGEGVDDADKLFSDILRSIGPKAEKAQVEPSETPEN